METTLISYYRSGNAMRSRSVGDVVLSGMVDVPVPPARLVADWERDALQHLDLEPGDVESLSLARTRMRWPAYPQCVQAVADWTRSLGFDTLLATSNIALMACRGAKYHHDGGQYGGAAFCNLFISEDKGLDLHFASTGHRIPLTRGTVVIFDTGQAHAVIARTSSGFNTADFPADRDCTQIFLTWELPIEHIHVGQALQITFDTNPDMALQLDDEQVQLNGTPVCVCPDSGRWCRPA
jgi:hypothetical protein